MVAMMNRSKKMMKKSNLPEAYICPITKELMVDPLMNRFGRSYERIAIIDHVANQEKLYCPVTREPMSVKDLVPNCKLRNEILTYREEILGDDTTTSNINVDDDSVRVVECMRALNVHFSPQKKSPRHTVKNLLSRYNKTSPVRA